MFDPIYEWLRSTLANIQTAINAALEAAGRAIDLLNPFTFIPFLTTWLLSWLPMPFAFTDIVSDGMVAAADRASTYIGFFDYFVHMPVLVGVVGVMLVCETVMLAVRTWRFVRSFIT